jgi:hypothetical protein
MQNFDKEGIVSIWLGLGNIQNLKDTDILKVLCGVEDYDIDNQEVDYYNEGNLTPISELLKNLSYSESFCEEVLVSSQNKRFEEGNFIIAQYDFAFDPSQLEHLEETDIVFIGCFPYVQ